MKLKMFLLAGTVAVAAAYPSSAGNPQRIGHTTLVPRHSNPDDKGMYCALIDPTNGYAYFVGSYLHKLDITGNLPVEIGPATNTGQFTEGVLDSANGNMYFPRGTLFKYSVGAGTNLPFASGSLGLVAGTASGIALDDSNPDPTKHYVYVLCTTSGQPAKVTKVALSNFTEIGSVTLAASETNFLFGAVSDPQNGYAYFVSNPNNSNVPPAVVKIKMTPGQNLPQRIGAVTLDTTGEFIDGSTIDRVHGYAYYGSYDSDTNIPGKVYKVKLESGDVPPTLVGHVNLHAGEGRLSAGVLDPTNGFVYFANDNTYPGALVQLSLNGTNLPVEVAYIPMQGGPNTNTPPNGVTGDNTTTNADGVLPYGEVYFRSAVFDPLHGCVYLGQDSRPNQVVKVQLAQIDPFKLGNATALNNGTFQFSFNNIFGGNFSVFATTNLTLPLSGWTSAGSVTEISPGSYQFMDLQASNNPARFYSVRSQ